MRPNLKVILSLREPGFAAADLTPDSQLSRTSNPRRTSPARQPGFAGRLAQLVASSGLLVAALLTISAPASAQLELVIDNSSGELFLKNAGVSSEIFDAYSFDSQDAFLVDSWVTITGVSDAAGDGSVDAAASWLILGPPPALNLTVSSNLAEASAIVGSAAFAPGQILSFGQVFDLTQPLELTGRITQGETAGGETIFTDLIGDFRDLTADYNGDLAIDLLDYDVFISSFGSLTDLRADGNGDGRVDAADYTVWRDSLVPPVSVASPLVAFSVPEPTTLILAIIAAAGAAPRRRTTW